jgi:hypothetical protein
MRLLVKNQEESEPKELVMLDKEEAKSLFVMKKYASANGGSNKCNG